MSIAVRSSVGPLTIVDQLRNETRGAANDQVFTKCDDGTAREWFVVTAPFLLQLFAIFAAVALLLASIGLYGVLSARRPASRRWASGWRLAPVQSTWSGSC